MQENSAKIKRAEKHARVFDSVGTSPFRFKIAETLDDLLNAYRLVYRKYVVRGYCKEKPSQLHYTRFCLFPDSRTFIMAEPENSEVCGTASVIADSPCGLPMETSFFEPINEIRKPGKKLAEVTLLSIKEFEGETVLSRYKQSIFGVFNFFRSIFYYARYSGVTDLLAAVHPRHETIYRQLTFQPIGNVVPYLGAQGNPACPMRLDLEAFCDPKFRDNPVQKYFLSDSKTLDPSQAPAHWDDWTREQLLSVDEPPISEEFSIFETYMKSCLATL